MTRKNMEMFQSTCPNCLNSHLKPFYQMEMVPVLSTVTLSSVQHSLSVPRADIELAFCRDCGFIFNRLFRLHNGFSHCGYEDQQSYSATFMNYLTHLAEDLVARHQLEGKTLLEIGCGKGDFISLLVKISGGKGIGIDPAYEEGRQNGKDLVFYRETFAPEHGRFDADFICCRHTLEHISQTRDFIGTIRSSIGRSRPVVFFEVPCVDRILDGFCFWDIYYEHCSYFSPGALAELFRSSGFEILDLRLAYDDQYLLLEAVPTDRDTSHKTFPPESTLARQQQKVVDFSDGIDAFAHRWRDRLGTWNKDGKKITLWGGGSKAVGFLSMFARESKNVEYVVDINPHMENNYIPGSGIRYVSPAFLQRSRPDVVIILNEIYAAEISETIRRLGLEPEIVTLGKDHVS